MAQAAQVAAQAIQAGEAEVAAAKEDNPLGDINGPLLAENQSLKQGLARVDELLKKDELETQMRGGSSQRFVMASPGMLSTAAEQPAVRPRVQRAGVHVGPGRVRVAAGGGVLADRLAEDWARGAGRHARRRAEGSAKVSQCPLLPLPKASTNLDLTLCRRSRPCRRRRRRTTINNVQLSGRNRRTV